MKVLRNTRTNKAYLINVSDDVPRYHNNESLKALGFVCPEANELDCYTVDKKSDFDKRKQIPVLERL